MFGEYVLEDAPYCSGCGCEAEVVNYVRYVNTGTRCGFICTCGTTTVGGVVV